MLYVLAAVAGAEAALALLLVSKVAPLVQLGQTVVELFKSSKGTAAVVKTLSGAFVVLLASDLSSVLKIQRHMEKSGTTLADQFLARSTMLEICLICFCLVLEIVVGSLHSSFKRIDGLSRDVDMLKKQAKGAQAEYLRLQGEQSLKSAKADEALVAEVKSQKEIISDLRQKLEQSQVDMNTKEKELKSIKTNLKALEKQTEGFQNEYTRLMDDNQNLRLQLSLFDRKYAKSDTKKYS